MTFRSHAVVTALLALTVAACSDSPSAIGDSMVGTYNLVSVNGQTPPVTVIVATGTIDVLSGQVDVKDNGTCRYTVQLRVGGLGTTQSNDCAWSRTGSAAFFTLDDGNLIAATVAEGKLSFTYFGAAFVLQR